MKALIDLSPRVPPSFTTLQLLTLDFTGIPEGAKARNSDTKTDVVFEGGVWKDYKRFDTDEFQVKSSMSGFLQGVPTLSEIILFQVFDVETLFEVDLPNSSCQCLVANSSSVELPIVSIADNGDQTNVGSITIPNTALTEATFSFPTALVLGVGDRLAIFGPSVESTVAGIFMNIVGKSKIPEY